MYVWIGVDGQYVFGIMVRLYRPCQRVNETIYHPFPSHYTKVSVFLSASHPETNYILVNGPTEIMSLPYILSA